MPSGGMDGPPGPPGEAAAHHSSIGAPILYAITSRGWAVERQDGTRLARGAPAQVMQKTAPDCRKFDLAYFVIRLFRPSDGRHVSCCRMIGQAAAPRPIPEDTP